MAEATEQWLIRAALIVDGSGRSVFRGDVLIEDERIRAVSGEAGALSSTSPPTRVIDGSELTVMPGLCDAHSHLGLIDADYYSIARIPADEHLRIAAKNAEKVLLAGFTMCIGAGAGKPDQDVALRDAITRGEVIGPRLLAAGAEISTTGSYVDGANSVAGESTPAIIASGVNGIREAARAVCSLPISILKIGISGDMGAPHAPATTTSMSDAEVAAAVSEARSRGIRVGAHARSAESVRLCLKHGVELISHADFIDEDSIVELGRRRDEFFVIPAFAYLARALDGDAEAIGFSAEMARKMGLDRELETQVLAMRRLKSLGVRILTGGDYGFAWTPHGTNARELQDFVELLGYSPLEAICVATHAGADAMGAAHELGQIKAGYLADILIIAGNPLSDIRILQNPDKLLGVMKNGQFVKRPLHWH